MRNLSRSCTCVVFRHNAAYSTQGPVFLLDPRDLSPAAIPSINTSLALLLTILVYCSLESGAAIKNVVVIFTVASGEGPTV